MVMPIKPENEAERLAELHSFGVLDTAPDPAFDEVVDLLASMLDMPVTLISLVDEHRQWFRARHGFEPSETPLDQSICGHAILDDGLLVIEDTLADPRTADNPLCCGTLSDMRFYAGAPLVTRSGHRIGTLCVLDTVPRQLSQRQKKLILVMARQVMRQLDLQRALRNKEILRGEIDHRVKNSLQTVASTIRLYRARLDSDDAREALDAVARRVDAISQLHAELNLTSKMHHVGLDTYLERVGHLLQRQAPSGTRIETYAEALEVDSRVAASLGIIANEFAANATKYAHPEQGEPLQIRFSLNRTGVNQMTLVCEDNGVHRLVSEEDSVPEWSSTALGGRMMEAAAAQVGGRLDQRREPQGYVLRAELPIELSAESSGNSDGVSGTAFREAARAAE